MKTPILTTYREAFLALLLENNEATRKAVMEALRPLSAIPDPDVCDHVEAMIAYIRNPSEFNAVRVSDTLQKLPP